MNPNIGRVNALIRITCGFSILACSTANMVKRPSQSSLPFAALGGMLVAEGITRFCPVTYLVKNSANKQNLHYQNDKQDQFAINPS
ncbi:YgaP family membrane protein [Halalkalibacter urbisdiaboli]|uniref:YgaP family membrane protein n=1 Tax=Halalkalibacter urbisdiaboli TaxID=1960589 RepID=UPI000B436194|nr:DUF2892 domain-containing protein [Halalkalibacter urbisdiaboli]